MKNKELKYKRAAEKQLIRQHGPEFLMILKWNILPSVCDVFIDGYRGCSWYITKNCVAGVPIIANNTGAAIRLRRPYDESIHQFSEQDTILVLNLAMHSLASMSLAKADFQMSQKSSNCYHKIYNKLLKSRNLNKILALID